MNRAFVVSLSGAVLIDHVKRRIETLRREVGEAKMRQAAFKRRMAQAARQLRGGVAGRGHLRPVPGGSVRDLTPGLPELVQAEVGKIVGDQKAGDLADGLAMGQEMIGEAELPDPLAPRIAEAERAIEDWTFMLHSVLSPHETYRLTWEDLHDFGLFAVPVEDMPIVYGTGGRGIR